MHRFSGTEQRESHDRVLMTAVQAVQHSASGRLLIYVDDPVTDPDFMKRESLFHIAISPRCEI